MIDKRYLMELELFKKHSEIFSGIRDYAITGGVAVNHYIPEKEYRRFSDDIDYLIREYVTIWRNLRVY